ncbi:hypothetical protein AAF712_000429 [Marasmius tenuissimus]|uniref:Carboxymuconolactone decarboxylase-like domain-containing protein n=1 Tax=Marasmius tenuissimus TaxID=585030 RepID=A0ABR3AFF9_9AGAR
MPNHEAHKAIYDEGMTVRRQVMGDDYVDNQLKKGVSEFMKPMQEVAWGTIWTRPGLERKQRSLINIALLAYQAKSAELAGHIRWESPNQNDSICSMTANDWPNSPEAQLSTARQRLKFARPCCTRPSTAEFRMESFRVAEEALKKLKEEGLLK